MQRTQSRRFQRLCRHASITVAGSFVLGLSMISTTSCSTSTAEDLFNETAANGVGGGNASSTTGGTPTSSGTGGSSTTSSGGGGSGGVGGSGGSGGTMGPVCGDGQVDLPGEQCDDGNANSGDGCSAACVYELSDGCPTAELVVGTMPLTFMGDTTVAMNDMAGTCGGASAGDYIFRIRAGLTGNLTATLNGNFNGNNLKVVYLHATCPAPQNASVTCNSAPQAQFTYPVLVDQVYYVGVDGNQGAEGSFNLTLVIQ